MNEPQKVSDRIRELLESSFWPEGIDSRNAYSRMHDDCDGDRSQRLAVAFSQDGDAWVWTDDKLGGALRFRVPLHGGGMSPRTRNALLILAVAIKLDNEERPL